MYIKSNGKHVCKLAGNSCCEKVGNARFHSYETWWLKKTLLRNSSRQQLFLLIQQKTTLHLWFGVSLHTERLLSQVHCALFFVIVNHASKKSEQKYNIYTCAATWPHIKPGMFTPKQNPYLQLLHPQHHLVSQPLHFQRHFAGMIHYE